MLALRARAERGLARAFRCRAAVRGEEKSRERRLAGRPSESDRGAFGPEASIVAMVMCFAVAVVFLWWMVKARRVEPAHTLISEV